MPILTCFKAYDIRGQVGRDIDANIAAAIGRALAQVLGAKQVVLGQDKRQSSPMLADAVARGLMDQGVEVLDLGLCGTEEVYFATGYLEADAGIMVTASHNPAGDNGMKMVKKDAAPLDPKTDLAQIRARAEAGDFGPALPGGSRRDVAGTRADYVARVVSLPDLTVLRPLKILVNAGNGAAGPTFDAIADALSAKAAPLSFTRIQHEPDASFPNGIPNPMLIENQAATADAVIASGADMGVAWDGDFDRCFFFDARGRFIAGEVIVALLAEVFLARMPGATIVHDPRIILSIRDAIAQAGGIAVQSPTGHAHLKAVMRATGAVYGGEISAHHYFRDFYNCDSGMIPWLMLVELMGRTGKSLAELVNERSARFPSSGEINFRPKDPDAAIARVIDALTPEAVSRDYMDGVSLTMPGWRFNLRRSNTEALVRLNVEAEGDRPLVQAMTERLTALLMG